MGQRNQCVAMTKGAKQEHFRHRCQKPSGPDGCFCAFHASVLDDPSWPLAEGFDRDDLRDALRRKDSEAEKRPLESPPAVPALSPPPSWWQKYLTEKAMPGIALFAIAALALLLEQVFLFPFGVDYTTLSGNFDTLELMLRNGAYLLFAFIFFAVVLAASISFVMLVFFPAVIFVCVSIATIFVVLAFAYALVAAARNLPRDLGVWFRKRDHGFRATRRAFYTHTIFWEIQDLAIKLISEYWDKTKYTPSKIFQFITANENPFNRKPFGIYSYAIAFLIVIMMAMLSNWWNSNTLAECAKESPAFSEFEECRNASSLQFAYKSGLDIALRRPALATLNFMDEPSQTARDWSLAADSNVELIERGVSVPVLNIGAYGDNLVVFPLGSTKGATIVKKSEVRLIAHFALDPPKKRPDMSVEVQTRDCGDYWLKVANFPENDAAAVRENVASVVNEIRREAASDGKCQQPPSGDLASAVNNVAKAIAEQAQGGSPCPEGEKCDRLAVAAEHVAAALGNPVSAQPDPAASVSSRLADIHRTLAAFKPEIRVDAPLLPQKVDIHVHQDGSAASSGRATSFSLFSPVIQISGAAGGTDAVPQEWRGIPAHIARLCARDQDPTTFDEPIGFPDAKITPANGLWRDKLVRIVGQVNEKISKPPSDGTKWVILVEGSADSRGTAMINLEFAEKRAAFIDRELETLFLRIDSSTSGIRNGEKRNWEIVSYGIGEQPGFDARQPDDDSASPRVVRVKLCKRAEPAKKDVTAAN